MNLELFKKDENKEISLTSLEIAELTGKEHFHVIRDIETYLEKVVEGVYPNLETPTKTHKISNLTSIIAYQKEKY
ncbi:Rha family transcriptional regulator [Campylobacter coli]